MLLKMSELEYNLREIKGRQHLYSENDFWTKDGDGTTNLLMKGETL